MKKISVIVPCYNEEQVLPVFYNAICDVAKSLSSYAFEFIFIDDGSEDETLSVLKSYSEKDERVLYLSFSRNFGKESAMYAGFVNATGDYVAVMDADMQDPPSLLPTMVEYLEKENYDSVATRRVTRQGEPPIRSFFARQFYKLMNKISDVDIVDGARDYRLMKKKMVDVICEMPEYNRFSKGIFGWIGFKTKWLPYENTERVAGETKWSFWKLFKYSIEGIVSFSQVPLAFVSYTGIAFTVFAFFMIIFFILRKLIFNNSVEGWASLVCIIIFIAGIQLFALGIIGQYLAKTYLEVKKRPVYVVSETNREDRVTLVK